MGEQAQTQQTYPYDLLFQRYLLALAVQDPAFLAAHRACLSPHYFEDKPLKFLSGTILSFYDHYGQVPAQAAMVEWVENALRSGNKSDIAQTVRDITNFLYQSEVPNADYIRDRAVHFARRQGLKRAVLRGIDVLRKDGDPEDAMDMFQEAMSIGAVQSEGLDVWEIIAKIPDMWDDMMSARGVIPTVILPSFDRALLAGGPRRGELYCIQGVPKGGKSMFMVNFGAAAIGGGFSVLHITIGDLKEFDVAHRYASRLTDTPMRTILSRDPGYIGALRNCFLEQGKLRVKYYSPYQLTTTHIRSYMSWLRATKGFQPDLLIVDYPDKMSYDRSNTYAEIGRIYMELKSICDDFNCVCWVASQSNRNARSAKLNTTENMSDSWDKVANADGIIPITRLDNQGAEVKDTANLDFEGPRTGSVQAFIENVRFGHDGFQIKVNYDFSRCQLWEDSPATKEKQKLQASLDQAASAVVRGVQPQPVFDTTHFVGPNSNV
jgi:KaiC/GvpD/RAD55 family RecA-like ATPase